MVLAQNISNALGIKPDDYRKVFDSLGIGSSREGQYSSGNALNRQEDLYNRYNINSPYGSRSYGTDAEGRATLNINETPMQKAIRELQYNQAFNTLGSKTYGPEDFAEQGQQINRATYQSALNNLNPQFKDQDTQLRDYLSNRGIPINSPAYAKALTDLRRDRGNQLNQLSLQSTLAGSAEQDRLTRLSEAIRAARLAETGGALQGIDLNYFGNTAGINAASNIANQEKAQYGRYQDTQKRRSEFLTGLLGAAGGAI
jgi:hypothetical protein